MCECLIPFLPLQFYTKKGIQILQRYRNNAKVASSGRGMFDKCQSLHQKTNVNIENFQRLLLKPENVFEKIQTTLLTLRNVFVYFSQYSDAIGLIH